MSQTPLLSAHLWDLRAQAESKLRCLTRLQQLVAEYDLCADHAERRTKHQQIIKDLTDIVTISKALRLAADEAFAAAQSLTE